MGPDEGAEGEQAVAHADEAKVRRGERTGGRAAAGSREAELPGEPSEARGCRGGGARHTQPEQQKPGPSRECQRPKACQRAKTAEGERRTMYRRAEGFELGLAWPDCNAITYSGMRAAAPVEIPPLRQLRASKPMGS